MAGAEVWAGELQGGDVSLNLRVRSTLHREDTEFQCIEVVDTYAYGRVMFLDGTFQVTEKDEFAYHEMLVHPALCAHEAPRSVLIIGGGDGGTLREVLRHENVERAVLCEIDARVCEVARTYLPSLSESLSAARADVRHEDGAALVAASPETFDVIIVDSPDPVGPAKTLYADDFYENCRRALRAGGLLVAQSESPFVNGDVLRHVALGVGRVFGESHVYLGPVPTYPSGSWSYTIAGLGVDPRLPKREPAFRTRYYDSAVHKAAFALPPFVRELVSR